MSQQASSEHQPLLQSGMDNNNSNTIGIDGSTKSLLYRARRAPLAIACVTAIALFVDMVVYGVVVPILPDIVKRLGGTSRDAGLLFACYAIGLLGSTPVFANLSDRYKNRRYPMMGGMLGMAIATFCFANADSYWMLILARTGQGMAGGASWTIGLGMLADVYPPDHLGVVMGTCLMFNTIGFLVGPTLGGALYEYYGLHAPFAVCAGLALFDFFAVVFIAEPNKNQFVCNTSTESSRDEEAATNTAPEEGIEDVVTSTKIAVDNASPLTEDPVKTAHEQLLRSEEHRHQHNSHHASPTAVPNYGSVGGLSGSSASSSPSRSRVSSTASATSSIASSNVSRTSPKKPGALEKDKDEDNEVGYLEIATEWTIVRCLLATLVASSAYSGIEPIFPLHLKEILGAGPALTGLVFTSAVVPSLLSPAIGYLADRKGRLLVASFGMVIFATASICLSLPKTIAGFILPLAFFGLGSSTIQAPLLPAMAHVATTKGWNAYARVYACYNMIYSGGMMVGPIVAGFLYDLFGFGWAMTAFGVAGFVMLPVIFGNEVVFVLHKLHGAICGGRSHE